MSTTFLDTMTSFFMSCQITEKPKTALNKRSAFCYIPVCRFLGSSVTFGFFRGGRGDLAVFFPLAMLSQYVFGPALFLISLFIVLIILLQRGRGGGLTGALGGAGGASAFGVKAGDIFTRITAVSVLLWIVLCALTCYWYLPEALDIASDPNSVSSKKSNAGEIGGMGSSATLPPSENLPESDPPPSEISTPQTSPSPAGSIDLPPANNVPPVSTEPDVRPVPANLPPAVVPETPIEPTTTNTPAPAAAAVPTDPKP